MVGENGMQSGTHHSRIRQILVAVAAVLTYGIFAGLCANTGQLCTEISFGTGLAYNDVTLAFTVMNLVLAFSVPVFAMLTLKIRAAFILMFGALMCAVGFFGAMIYPTVASLIVFIGIIFGLGAASLSFTIVYTAAKPFFGEKGSAILSGIVLASQGGVGFLLSTLIGGVTGSIGILPCLGLISFISLTFFIVPAIFIQRRRKRQQEIPVPDPAMVPKPRTSTIIRKLFTNRFFYLLFFGVFAFAMGDGLFVNHASQMYYEMLNLDESSISLITNLYTIGIMTGAFVGGIVSSRAKNRELAVSISFLGIIVVNFGLLAINLIHIENGTGLTVANASLLFLIAFLVHTCFVQLVGIASDHVTPAVSAVVIGLLDSLGYLTYSLNSLLGASLYAVFEDFILIYIMVVIIIFLAGLAFLIYGYRHRKAEPIQYI